MRIKSERVLHTECLQGNWYAFSMQFCIKFPAYEKNLNSKFIISKITEYYICLN
jgi:hypothetical protein